MKLPIDTLRQLLDVDPDTGILTWRHRPREYFLTEQHYKSWNANFPGKRALATLDAYGYFVGIILCKRVRAHRIIWALVHGCWPNEIDHINGIRNDNRLCNLRSVTHAENTKNTRMRNDNKSGFTGVFWDKRHNNWLAYIKVDQAHKHLGNFSNIEDAKIARRAAEIKYGYHPNHGLSFQ